MKSLFLTLLLAVAWQAEATNPPPREAVLSISARDSQNPNRVAYSGGTLEMIGEGRGASLYATYGPKENGVPRWISEGASLGSGEGVTHYGGSAGYTCYFSGIRRSIQIKQVTQSTTTISVESPEAFEKTLKSLNDFSERFDLGATASASVSASLSFYPVEKKASPLVQNHYDLTIGSASAGLAWEDIKVGALGHVIKVHKTVEIKCGAFTDGSIALSASGGVSYDPNDGVKGGVGAALGGSAKIKLQGRCNVKVWGIDAGGGVEASGAIHLTLVEEGSTVNKSGVSLNGSLTTGVTLAGEAYAYVGNKRYVESWTYNPPALQGSMPIGCTFNFPGG